MKRVLALILLSPMTLAAPSKPRQEALILPYRALQLGVEVERGLVVTGNILSNCLAMKEDASFKEHQDSFIHLECDRGVRLKINNIIFDEGEKIPLKVVQADMLK